MVADFVASRIEPEVLQSRTHRQVAEAWKKDPEFKAAYDELETDFALLRELLAARRRAGLTQARALKATRK
jgi:hypothetical protein